MFEGVPNLSFCLSSSLFINFDSPCLIVCVPFGTISLSLSFILSRFRCLFVSIHGSLSISRSLCISMCKYARCSSPRTLPTSRCSSRTAGRRLRPARPAVRNACAHAPCSATAHAHGSAGDTHVLRDGDEADADEREQAAAMPAESGEWRQSDPSHSPG